MSDRAVFIPTRVGPLAAVVTEPSGETHSAVLFLHGVGYRDRDASRSGTNQVWTRLAHALAAEGTAVLRVDYPGTGDSDNSRPRRNTDLVVAADALEWWRGQTQVDDIRLIGTCFGGRNAILLAPAATVITGMAVLVPLLRPVHRGMRRRWHRRHDADAFDEDVIASFRSTVTRIPTLMVTGEHDLVARQLPALRRRLGPAADALEIEIEPDLHMHGYGSRAAQDVAIERILAWSRRRVAVPESL